MYSISEMFITFSSNKKIIYTMNVFIIEIKSMIVITNLITKHAFILEVKEETENTAQLEKDYKREMKRMDEEVCFISTDIYHIKLFVYIIVKGIWINLLNIF